MKKTKAYLNAARLRTLPLSVSGIITGSAVALIDHAFDIQIFLLAIITTIGFQVLSNFANDYGDGVKGTDNEERIGPARAMQSGLLTASELKAAIVITGVISLLSAMILIYLAFGTDYLWYALLFFILGLISVMAAITYTVGRSAYGYRGLGDLFVFLFFGLLAVVGCYFLYTKALTVEVFLPAVTIGFFSVGVLNLNNMRDIKSDRNAGKITLAVKMGINKARTYHYVLVVAGMLSSLYFAYLNFSSWFNFLFVLSFIPLGLHLKRVADSKDPSVLDKELKPLALSTFLFSILFMTGFNIFL
ncbi:1,4-dihydroxy-2-naphthoate polyprenyltransferase [Robertkochia aurantiaca]|uniref:1,4-dihydroxy-2-naphthoate polyprenyltransferase n=1 Tax=Robertkochia aurantiaca TaxID=2873700 RepID=UPI001CCD7B0E|nr:1,4-dihydroxy-2-naphthoate polyprenyltransferase [Robertkochia sp. 3YJGBD-33]